MFNNLYHSIRYLIRAYKYKSGYDKSEIKFVLDTLQEGDIAIDIGAHKGAYAYWMRSAVKRTGRVICIEPQPILIEYLRKLMPIVGFGNVELLDCAVSDKDGEAEIIVPGKPGDVSQCARIADKELLKKRQEDNVHTIKVHVRALDSMLDEKGWKPKLVKIDVEGHEFNVLKGMEKTLSIIRPYIIIECEARHIKGLSVFEVFDFLLQRNYQGYYFYQGKKKSIVEFDLNRDQVNRLSPEGHPQKDYIANFIFEPV